VPWTADQYVFGPVPSRRLGRSLGVDLVRFKTCSYDCVYCQLGPTICRTLDCRQRVPVKDVLTQVQEALAADPAADFVTLAGSGEPTLNSDCAAVIAGIKRITDIPVAILTNGSLLWRPTVRTALMEADLVIPSLDAGDAATFRAVNRPHAQLDFDQMVDGLVVFRQEFSKPVWLEVFLAEGINSQEEQVRAIAHHAARIRPDKVQLNTVARPPAEPGVKGLSELALQQCAAVFEGPVEVIADYTAALCSPRQQADENTVLAMIRRRPCTVQDISAALGLHANEVIKHLGHLRRQDRLTCTSIAGHEYYAARTDGPDGNNAPA
jgi:wyosine [tRNA(Phe)-imidazoG37] synthetase (radical SAM superfamily)